MSPDLPDAPSTVGNAREPAHASSGRDRALTAFLVLEVLTLFVAAPLAATGIQFPLIVGGLISSSLLLAIVVISRSPGGRVLATLATALAVAGAAYRIHHPSPMTVWLGHLAVIAALLAISLVIAQAVFAPGRITHHRLEGAVVLYLNMALAFTSVFRLLQELDPGAFSRIEIQGGEAAAYGVMLYFSFTTLTSTGFGEIVPLGPFARSMTNLESVMGQLYLVILLGRLVSMHVESRRY